MITSSTHHDYFVNAPLLCGDIIPSPLRHISNQLSGLFIMQSIYHRKTYHELKALIHFLDSPKLFRTQISEYKDKWFHNPKAWNSLCNRQQIRRSSRYLVRKNAVLCVDKTISNKERISELSTLATVENLVSSQLSEFLGLDSSFLTLIKQKL